MKKRILMVLLAVALLVTAAAFAVQATELEEPTHTYLNLDTFICPCSKCDGKPYNGEWIKTYTAPGNTVDGGHYYYKDMNLKPGSGLQYTKSGEYVLVLDNTTISCSAGARALLLGTGTMHIVGNNATIQGKGLSSTSANGGIVQVYSSGKMHLYDSLTIQRTAGSTNAALNGGLFRVTGGATLAIHEGVVLNGHTVTGSGGAVWLEKGTKLIMDGGTINGGTATNGGAVAMEAATSAARSTIEFSGGTITSGTAKSGGNLYISSYCTVNISGTAKITSGITNGVSDDGQGGGNVFQGGGTVNMTGGTIENATYEEGTKPQGGNIRQNSGTFNLSGDGIIQNGETSNLGGNVRVGSTFNVKGGQILGGTSASSGGSLAIVGTSAALNISAGTISGGDGTQAKNGVGGGLLYINSGTVTISGTAVMENGYATNGGLIRQDGGTLDIQGGTLRDGKASGDGGNIYRGGGTLTISGGSISGGDADDGGNLYFAGSATISGGTISDGTATNGGNIFQSSGTVTLSGGTITKGEAKYGGNIYAYHGSLNIAQADGKTLTISDGKATENGGNLYANSVTEGSGTSAETRKAEVTISAGTISGGTAKQGASIFSSTDITMSGGTISGGAASGNGGTIYQANGTHGDTFTMTGGIINGGTSKSQGGVAFLAGGTKADISGDATINVATTGSGAKGFRVVSGAAVTLSGNATVNYNGLRAGDALDVVSTSSTTASSVTLSGAASVINVGTASAAGIHIQNFKNESGNFCHAKLIIKDDWSGNARFAMEYYANGSNAEDTITYGETINSALGQVVDAAGDGISAFTGKLYFVTKGVGVCGDGANLVLAKTSIRTNDGYTYYLNNDNAAAAYDDYNVPAYIRLYTTDELNLGELSGVYVDIYGHDVTVNCTNPVNVLDTTGDYSGATKGSVKGNVNFVQKNPLSSTYYVALADAENGYKLHLLSVAISGVTVRPESAGMYYRATIQCDADLQKLIDTYGVAVSVVAMPGADFAGENTAKAMYTSYNDSTKLTSGTAFNGVLINNIMRKDKADIDKKTNSGRAEKPIYANAYVVIEIDEDHVYTVMADEVNGGTTNGIAKNLKSLMHDVDGLYAEKKLDNDQMKALVAMYEKFQDVFEFVDDEPDENKRLKSWDVPTIKQAFETANPTT